jgi:hypothetical protein
MAVFTETVRATADALRKEVAGIDDPSERLHRLTIEYHRRCRPARPGAGLGSALPALADVAQQLLLGQPGAASQAFLPLKDLFDEALAAAGLVRGDGLVTGVMLQTIMFHTFASTISGSRRPEPDAAEALWELILNGIGTPAGVG